MKPNSPPISTPRFPINLRHLALVLIGLAGVAWWCHPGPAPDGPGEPVRVTSRQVVDGSTGPDGPRDTRSSRQRQPVAADAATGSAVAALADGFRRAGGGSVAPEVLAGLRGSKRGDAVEVRLPGLRLSGGVDSVLDEGGVWHVGIEVADGRGRMVVSGRDDGLLTATVNLYGEEPGLKLANSLADPQVRIEELPYYKMVCAEPGTRYPAKPAVEGAAFAPPTGGGEEMPRNGPQGPVVELQGLPGAVAVLYIDLDGETVTHPKWSANPIVCAAHADHTDAAWVTRVWQRVCEDFAPFAINVTTVRAAYDKAPTNMRVMCVVTPSQAWLGNATPIGGVAFIGDFRIGTPCFAFKDDEYSSAETISHEAGHTMGLHHDGRKTPLEVYYAGHGTGLTSWAPIMGAGYLLTPFKNVTQWSCGEYPEADNQEDDLSLIASAVNAFGYRLDDKGNTKEGASPLGVVGTTVGDAGIIERPSDVDWLRFTAGAGTVALTVAPLDLNSADTTGANLAVKLRLYDANGGLLQEADDPSGLAATLAQTVGTGTYYLTVEGAARGTAATGFTKYGSLGQYTVSGTVPAVVSDTVPPTVAITSPGGGTVDVPDLTVAGTADDNVAVATVEVRLNGGAWMPAAGTQSWSLAVTLAAGANLIEARARDMAGNLSATATRSITYAASAPRLVVEHPAGRALTSGVSSVSFGSRAVGLAFTKTFTLRNAGTAPLTGLALTLAGANPEDFSVGTLTATSLLPGASATVSVSFAATAEGMRNATLQIASNDPLRNPFRIGLSGTGLPAPGTQYLWTNFVGMPGGAGSVDGTGIAARFNHPYGIAVDGSGNLYVADRDNSTIRKVTPAGVVTTLAGSPGQSGSVDGVGSTARFNYPRGIAVDGSGNLFVADTLNHTVRKVTPAGVVTTLAGSPNQIGYTDGTGSAARFYYPYGIAADASGNLYVTDGEARTIRKVTTSGVVTTLAGSPNQIGYTDGTGSSARFDTPWGITVDGAGNVYVVENNRCTIRKITPSGVVTTLAGSPGQGGSTDGVGGAARFFYPRGITVDTSGNLYVTDAYNHTIRKVTPEGVVTTLAGSPGQSGSTDGTGSAARFHAPDGIAVDGGGNLYVADYYNSLVRKVMPSGVVATLAGSRGQQGGVDGAGSDARFSSPRGISADGSGNFYVADCENHTIRKVTPSGLVTTFAGTPGSVGSRDGFGSAAIFFWPEGIAVDGSGNLFVADSGNCTIRKVTPDGMVTTLAGIPGWSGSEDGSAISYAARFDHPSGITMDGSGNLYVADYNNDTIRKVTPGRMVTTLAGNPGIIGPRGSADGTGEAARFAGPTGIAIDAGGNLHVTDTDNHTIRKVTDSGVVTTLVGSPGQPGSTDGRGNEARFKWPYGITADGGGNLYVADSGNHTIRKMTPSGVVTTIGGRAGQGAGNDGIGTAARFSSPRGIAVSASGLIYVADANNNRIVIGTPLSAGAVTPPLTAWRLDRFGTSSNSGAAADAADPDSDGRSNLLEFALNGNPHVSDPSLQPVPCRTGNLMRLNYTRRSDALDEGLSFAVEWSFDLKADSWSTLGVSETILSDDATTQDVEATVPLAGQRMFLRLRVSKEQD